MVASVDTLSETVDLTRIDRRLADKIEADLPRIRQDIDEKGFSDVVVDGKTFRVTKRVAQGAAA